MEMGEYSFVITKKKAACTNLIDNSSWCVLSFTKYTLFAFLKKLGHPIPFANFMEKSDKLNFLFIGRFIVDDLSITVLSQLIGLLILIIKKK